MEWSEKLGRSIRVRRASYVACSLLAGALLLGGTAALASTLGQEDDSRGVRGEMHSGSLVQNEPKPSAAQPVRKPELLAVNPFMDTPLEEKEENGQSTSGSKTYNLPAIPAAYPIGQPRPTLLLPAIPGHSMQAARANQPVQPSQPAAPAAKPEKQENKEARITFYGGDNINFSENGGAIPEEDGHGQQ